MSTLAMNYYPISTSTQQTCWNGRGVEAEGIYNKLNEILVDIKPSTQLWVFNELEELRITASHKNWDNLGSAPLDSDTYQIAKRFILALPSSLPAPELTVDRDGEVTFDWFTSKGQIFTASLRKDGQISFAGQISTRKRLSGIEEFNDSVPRQVLEGVETIFSR